MRRAIVPRLTRRRMTGKGNACACRKTGVQPFFTNSVRRTSPLISFERTSIRSGSSVK